MKLLLNIALGAFVLTVAHAAWTEPNAEAKHDDEAIGTLPLLRGALWWLVPPCTDWSNERLEQAIQAQCDIGFDLLWIFNTPGLLDQAEQAAAATPNGDFLEMVYAIADAKDMRVIADLPKGGWHGKAPAADMLAINRDYIARYAARYGGHPSFWGWYLNYEINPIAPDDTQQTAFWREVWRDVVQACHNAAPGSVVTISPFFLLDDAGHRGFRYQTPEEYARWWGATMKATGIDILMLQDSGEHLSFFTIEQGGEYETAFTHADEAETSLGLLLFPDMVNMEYAVDTEPISYLPGGHFDSSVDSFRRPSRWSECEGHAAIEITGTPEGVVGKARSATAQKAKRPMAAILRYLTLVYDEILEAFPAGSVPPVDMTTLRTSEDMEPYLREPLSPGWKSVYGLSRLAL